MPTLLDHDLADEAPQGPLVTWYDRDHVITYVRLLDAEKESADWRDASRIVLHVDPDREPDRAPRLRHPSLSGEVDDEVRVPVPSAHRRVRPNETNRTIEIGSAW